MISFSQTVGHLIGRLWWWKGAKSCHGHTAGDHSEARNLEGDLLIEGNHFTDMDLEEDHSIYSDLEEDNSIASDLEWVHSVASD